MGRPSGPALLLIALVFASATARAVVALGVPSPWFTPDELVYAALGESLWRTGHFAILGATPDFFGLIYPAFVGLPLVLGGVETGYQLLKPLQALVMSLAAVPVYLWGRNLMPPRFALLAATLTLSVPGLAYAGFLMTEVAFYPILTLAAWAMARALARPTLGAQSLLVGALVCAVLTRLQALALLGVLAVAVGLKVLFARAGLRGLRLFAPLAVGLAGIAMAWFAVAAARGGSVLGAYEVTSQEGAPASVAARFVLYHAGDLLLLTALIPVLALGVLLWEAVRGRERSPDAQALVAVAVALAVVSIVQVGVFAASWVGHVAERNLLAVAPPIFLVFSLWLARGAPRPRSAWVVFAAGLALVAVVPWDELAVAVALPDAFSLIPLNELVTRSPETSLRLTVFAAALPLATAWLLVPRHFAWTLGAAVVALLVGASIIVSRITSDQADVYEANIVGSEKRWIDHATRGPVAFLYAGERVWSAGAPVWLAAFWNRSIDRVYTLYDPRVAGPLPTRRIRVSDDGRLLLADGGRADADARYLATSSAWAVRGDLIGSSSAGYRLWRSTGPLRFSTRFVGVRLGDLALGPRARLTVYDCGGGQADLGLYGVQRTEIGLRSFGRPTRLVGIEQGQTWTGRVALTPLPGRRVCQIDVVGGRARLTSFTPQRGA